MATASSLFKSEEKANYYRLYCLLSDVGSQVLRNTFQRVRPPGALQWFLADPQIHAKLLSFRQKEVISLSDWDKLYPAVSSSITSEEFEIELLGILLVSICNLDAPETGWNKFPPMTDSSVQADITRLRFYHYNVIGTYPIQASINDALFNICWKNVKMVLLRLGGAVYEDPINHYRNKTLEDVDERVYREFPREPRKGSLYNMYKTLQKSLTLGSSEAVKATARKRDTVPAEIFARGPLTPYAYRGALMEGKAKVKRLSIILIGQERAGKTSLKRSLKGQPFNANQESTQGIEIDRSYFKLVKETWGSQKLDFPGTSFDHVIARAIANDLTGDDETTGFPTRVEGTLQAHHDLRISPENCGATCNSNDANNSDQVHRTSSVTDPGMPDELVPLLTKEICKDTRSNDQQEIDSILFDFGGQLVYYVTHPLFLTPRAIYLLTYDLSRNPNDRASQWMTEGSSTKRKENLCLDTNWDYLDSWLSSVASLANQSCLNEATSRNSENIPEKLPAVFLVCTHADRPYCANTASSLAAGIFESLQGKPYSGHLYKGVFAVDNTKSGGWFWCPEVKRLRKAILDVANELPHSEEDLPIKWLKFEKELKAKVEEGHRWITFESARQTAFGRCHIFDEKEFLMLMNYLHNQRIVIHFANTPSLNEMVVLDIQWLIDVFKKVITVEPHGVEGSQCRERWLKFAKTGILDEELLEHLWDDLNQQKEIVQSLTIIMEKFSLMCTWPSLNGRKQYLVPSMLISHPSEEVKSLVASSRLPSLYISFHSCQVPTSLFPRMVLQFYQWCSEEWPNLYQPQLYHNFARFLILPEEGCSIILLSHSSFIEVVAHQATGICDASNGSGGNSDFPTSVTEHTSDVLVARAVRRQLVLMLECMRKEFPWLKDMKWKLKVLCSVCCRGNSVIYCRDHGVKGCKKEQCLHFWSEANFARDQQFVVCDRSACAADLRLDVRKFAPWFNFLEVQQVQVDRDWCSSKKLSSSEEKEAKELVLSSGALDFLHSTSNASSVVVPILNKLQLSQEALTNPLPETTRIVRSLVRIAKTENRYDVVKHLKEITPAGTAGPLLPEELDLQNISPSKLTELTINLCGGDEWKLFAEKLGLSAAEIRYLDNRTVNPCLEALMHSRRQRFIDVGSLYDTLTECEQPMLADLL